MKPNGLAERYRVDDGSRFRLAVWDPADTNGLADETSVEGLVQLSEAQERLCAQGPRRPMRT